MDTDQYKGFILLLNNALSLVNFYKDSKGHQHYSLHVPHITVQFQAASARPTNFPPPFLLHNHLGIHYWTAQVFNALISAFRHIFFFSEEAKLSARIKQ